MKSDTTDPLDAAHAAWEAGDAWYYWAEPDGPESTGVGVRARTTLRPRSTHGLDWSDVSLPDGPTFVSVAFDRIDPTGPWGEFAPVELMSADRLVVRERLRSTPPGAAPAVTVGPGRYPERVAAALRAIDAGLVDKVVVARQAVLDVADPIATLRALRDAFPTCWVFGRSNGTTVFLGASPERLVSVRGRDVRTVALAGSIGRGENADEDRRLTDRLLRSDKDRREHRWVVDAIADSLQPFCHDLDVPDEPEVRRLDNVQHLQSSITGTLRRPDPLPLIGALHPTPAVCGHPREAAARLIRELEPFERGLYAGVVGLIDGSNAELCVAIRSGLFDDQGTRLFAGAGIVAASDPEAEHRETTDKLQAVGRWMRGAR